MGRIYYASSLRGSAHEDEDEDLFVNGKLSTILAGAYGGNIPPTLTPLSLLRFNRAQLQLDENDK